MKKLLALLLLCSFYGFASAQTGASCADAIPMPLHNSCTSQQVTTEQEIWYSVIPDSTEFVVTIENNGLPATRLMRHLSFYSGSCASLSLLGSDSVTFLGDSVLALNVGGLSAGQVYYIKVSRDLLPIICRTCTDPPAEYRLCAKNVSPLGLRPSITITTSSGSFQCAFPNFSCGPTPVPSCALTICTGELVGFATYSTGLSSMPFDFYTTNPPANCDGTNGVIIWDFNGSNTPIQTNTQSNSPQNIEISYSNIYWAVPGNYVVDVYYQSGCDDCGASWYEWLIPVTVVGPNINITSTPVSCFGGNDGTASVPTAPNSNYYWLPGGQTTSTITGLTAGTYTLQASDGCYSEATVTITQPTPLQLTTGVVDEQCQSADNGQATVTVTGGTAPYSYSWNTNPIQTTSTIIGLDAGVYTVIVTDANGCTAQANAIVGSQPVLAAPAISSNALNQNLCASSIVTYTITNYDLNNPSYAITYNPAPLSVTNPSAGVYIVNWGTACTDVTFSVSVNNGNAACSVSSSVIVNQCCACSITSNDAIMNGTIGQDDLLDLYSLYNASGIITLSGNTYTYNNPAGVLYINGTFTVPTGKTFVVNSSDVMFGGNAKINLVGNAQMRITGSHLHAGCNSMWDGIYINPLANLTVNGSSLVEDAINAVVSVNGGQYTLNDAVFNKNRIAVYVKAYTGNHPGVIKNTVITCRNLPATATTATTKGAFQNTFIQIYPVANFSTATLLSPYSGERSYAGFFIEKNGYTVVNNNTHLVLTNTGVNVGSQIGYANLNVFDNLDYGVYAVNSNVEVINNAFQFLTGSTTLNPPSTPEKGIAVYGITDASTGERVMTVGGLSVQRKNTVYNANRGVDLNGYYKFNIYNNLFQSTQVYIAGGGGQPSPVGNYAIFTKSGRYADVYINANTIINWNIGIAFFGDAVIVSPNQQLKFFGDARINGNNIRPTIQPNATITTQFVRQAIIAENIIPACAPSCISSTVFGRLYIDNNDLYNVFNGIQIKGWSKNPQVAGSGGFTQDIYLRYQPNFGPQVFSQAGIRVINCSRAIIYKNAIDGDALNVSKQKARGIYASNNGSPYVRCNTVNNVGQCLVFEGANTNAQIWDNYMNSSQDGFVLLNNGNVGPQGAPASSQNPLGIAAMDFWVGPFTHAATYTMNTTAPNTHSPFYYRNNGNPQEHPTGILNKTTGIPSADDYNAVGPPNGFNPVSAFLPLRNCVQSPPLAQIGSGQQNQQLALELIVMDSAGTVDSATQYLRKQQVYQTLRFDPSWTVGSPVLQQFFNTYQPANPGAIENVDDELSANNLNGASISNSGITPVNLIEQNHRTVNAIYASLATGAAATPQQVGDLQAIAWQCPLEGGNAVYRARTLLCLVMDEVIFFDDSCVVLSTARMQQPESEQAPAVKSSGNCKVYPNPNDGNMTLEYEAQENQSGEFAIFDMTGRQVATYQLLPGNNRMEINLTGLSTGMYFYKMVLDGQVVKSDKLIINR